MKQQHICRGIYRRCLTQGSSGIWLDPLAGLH